MISVAISIAVQWTFVCDFEEWDKYMISLVPCKARHVGRTYVIMALVEFVVTKEREMTQEPQRQLSVAARMPALRKGCCMYLGSERVCQART